MRGHPANEIAPPLARSPSMPTLRLTLHVLLAGLYVFLTSLMVPAQWSSDGSFAGVVVLTLVGAWAGASSMLRTMPTLIAAGAGIGAMFLFALAGGVFNHYLGLFILVVMVPLALSLWAVVAWRASAETNEPPRATLPA